MLLDFEKIPPKHSFCSAIMICRSIIMILLLKCLTVEKYCIHICATRYMIFNELLFELRQNYLSSLIYHFVKLTCLFVTTLWICYMIPPQTLKAICIRLAPHPIIPLGMWRMRYIWIFYVISLMIPFYSMVYTVYSFVKISEWSAWMFWLTELGKVMLYSTFLSHRLIK